MAGLKGKLWVDGRLCFESPDGEVEVHGDPFSFEVFGERSMKKNPSI